MCGWRKNSTGWPRPLPEFFIFESGRQLLHHGTAFRLAHGKPGADLLQGAPAAQAQARPGVIGADFDAGAFHVLVYGVFDRKTQSFQPSPSKMGSGLNRGLTARA